MHAKRSEPADIRSIRIVARTNGVGMDRDVRLLRDAIAEIGGAPEFSRYRSISPLRRWFDRRDDEQCIIFLERVTARWLRRAGRYLLIPNQERYPERLVPLLRRIDHVLCKSHHAVEVFAARHPSVHYLGFTSEDRGMPAIRPDYGRFLHLAGASNLKGTPALLEVWSRHPEWPVLTLLMHRRDAPRHVPPNVNLITDYLPDERLRVLQNTCGVHLCPSLSEGWGHYIVEAMSCRAVTITTDGPPMNELVTPERGVLAAVARTEPRKLGTNFHVDADALEAAIQARLNAPTEENARVGEAARAWYESNDRAFRARLGSLVASLLPGATDAPI